MQVDNALVDKLSRLSMLRFNESEKEEIRLDLEKMIDFVDKLKELDLSGIEPLIHMTTHENIVRDDLPGNMISQPDALGMAPAQDGGYFTVPRVIKKPGEA